MFQTVWTLCLVQPRANVVFTLRVNVFEGSYCLRRIFWHQVVVVVAERLLNNGGNVENCVKWMLSAPVLNTHHQQNPTFESGIDIRAIWYPTEDIWFIITGSLQNTQKCSFTTTSHRTCENVWSLNVVQKKKKFYGIKQKTFRKNYQKEQYVLEGFFFF